MKTFLIALLASVSCFGQSYRLSDEAFLGGTSRNQIPRNGLLAEYRFDKGSGQTDYNRAANTGVDVNLLRAPEQLFSMAGFWTASGATATDYYAAAPNGYTTASRFVAASGNNFLRPPTPGVVTFTAVPYTLSVHVKSNTGGTQTFRMAYASPSTFIYSSDQTATTAWQRFSYTFTPSATSSGSVILLSTDSASNAVDVVIWGGQLELGSSATTYTPKHYNQTLGVAPQPDASDPAWLTNGLNFTTSQYLYGVQENPSTISGMSIYAVCKRSGTPVLSGYLPLVSDNWTGIKFQLSGDKTASGIPSFEFNGTVANAYSALQIDGLWHVISGTYNGTTNKFYLDGIEMAAVARTGSISLRSIFISNFNFAGYWAGSISRVLVYNVGHTASQVSSVTSTLTNISGARGISIAPITRFVVWEGDSITDPAATVTPVDKYTYRTPTNWSAMVQGRNFAVTGSTLATMSNRLAYVEAMYSNSRTNVLSVLIGRNDLLGQTLTQTTNFVANLKTYCSGRRSVGFKLMLCTILPSTAAGFNANRNVANGLIYADSSFYDVLCDFAADPTMGPDAAASDTSLYGDGTHPTVLGQSYMTVVATNALRVLLP